MTVGNSGQIPYQACLMTIFPEELQHQLRDITNHIVTPLNMLVAVMSFACNALVVYTVTRTKCLQRPPHIMLCSLAFTDLLYAVYCFVRFTVILTHQHMCPDRTIDAIQMLSPLCIQATLGNLAVISRDRYLAVKRPWWYRMYVTKPRVIKMICVPWVLSAIITITMYSSWKFTGAGNFPPVDRIAAAAFYLVCFTVIGFSYLSLCFKKTPTEEEPYIRAILKREKRMANTVGLILLVLLVTFLPGVLIPLALNAKGVPNFLVYKPFYDFLFLLNGFFNPLLNFGRSKEMRRAVRQLMTCSQEVQPSLDAWVPQRQEQHKLQQQNVNNNTKDKSNSSSNIISRNNKIQQPSKNIDSSNNDKISNSYMGTKNTSNNSGSNNNIPSNDVFYEVHEIEADNNTDN